jgi:NADH-quinone oxidoreductase subunit G
MPRPQQNWITFSIDGREVRAPENIMLADAAKYGDVEIPVFCYEPKLGQPVGACRMCLVEIEGIPKLQTGCSTAVKDGMVVHTQTERVRTAQEAVVEFLLINHPLDCPVCDKGGECPLQDITFGWGGGVSRFIEPKRHFRKPVELSPLIAIDRERCILCYRCVRFSQEVAEDYQLVLEERGAHSFVSTFDGHPYVAPFSGNIVELCPVGALTSRPYRFRARPWDIENAGTVCTLCPSQCNILLTVRDERVMRVLDRHNPGVDDGWLCDKGRFAYQAVHVDERVTAPMVRDGGELRAVSWERALDEASAGLRRAGGRVGALAGGQASSEEGFLLQRLLRDALGSPHLDSRVHAALDLDTHRALSAPALQASVEDVEFANAVLVLGCEPLDESPILDLRIRKGVRRRRVALAVAGSRPSALDPGARTSVRYAPGGDGAFLAALHAALTGAPHAEQARAAGADADAVAALARLLSGGGEDVVVVWGERLLDGPAGPQAASSLLALAAALGLEGREGAGLLEIPAGANARGLREAGVLPCAGPGYAEPTDRGLPAAGIARALAEGELVALYLLHADPLDTHPDRALWARALERASTVIAHAGFLTDGIREHANVVFPAQSYAEKEGTVVHPDGRLQRLRPGIANPGEIRAEWQILVELAHRAGLDTRVFAGPMASAQLYAAVPFYEGVTLDGLSGHGLRWPESEAARAVPAADAPPSETAAVPAPAQDGGRLRLGTFRPLWAAPEVHASPALHFLHPEQMLQLSPADARRAGVQNGEWAQVSANGSGSVRARVVERDAVPAGVALLNEGVPGAPATALRTGMLVEVSPAPEPEPEPDPDPVLAGTPEEA